MVDLVKYLVKIGYTQLIPRLINLKEGGVSALFEDRNFRIFLWEYCATYIFGVLRV